MAARVSRLSEESERMLFRRSATLGLAQDASASAQAKCPRESASIRSASSGRWSRFWRRRRRWERDIARCSEATHCGAGEEARRTDQRHGTCSGEGPFAEECKQSRQVASQLTSVRKQLCAARRDAKTKRAQLLRARERKNLPPKRDSLRSDERYQAMVRPAHELCVPGLGHSA